MVGGEATTRVRSELVAGLASCFWLLVPLLAVDALFTGRLPSMYQRPLFWTDIPPELAYAENVLRVLVVAVPLLIPLSVSGRRSRLGLALYLVGAAAYLAGWFALIIWPGSAWSSSAAGLLAPAYTPLIWAVGIGVIGRPRQVPAAIAGWLYPSIAVAFTAVHFVHAVIAYGRVSS